MYPATRPLQPIPEFLIAEEKRLGLEHFLVLGHPERRHEIWDNRSPCVLPFGSEKEARKRFQELLEDACRWEGLPAVKPAPLDPDGEAAEVGRFRILRRGRRVHLEVTVDAKKYRDLLHVWTQHEAWDWGESEASSS